MTRAFHFLSGLICLFCEHNVNVNTGSNQNLLISKSNYNILPIPSPQNTSRDELIFLFRIMHAFFRPLHL